MTIIEFIMNVFGCNANNAAAICVLTATVVAISIVASIFHLLDCTFAESSLRKSLLSTILMIATFIGLTYAVAFVDSQRQTVILKRHHVSIETLNAT